MGLKVWLPLNGNLENKGATSPPILMGSGITYTAGKIGQAATFPNNCNSCIHMTPLRLQTGSWTAWIKVAGTGATSRQCLISEGRDSYSDGVEFYTNQAGTTLYFKAHEKTLSTSIELNKWYHAVGTFGDGVVSLYLDGVLKGTSTYTTDMTYTYASDFVLGKMSYGYTNTSNYFPFNGQLNDVRVYDNVLSQKEVKEISQGLVLHYPLNGYFGSGENLLRNSKPEASHVYNSSALIYHYFSFSGNLPTGTYTFSFDIKSSNGTDACYCSYANGSSTINRIATLTNIPTTYTRYSYTFTSSATNCNDIFFAHYTGHGSPVNTNNTGTIYVKNVKLERGDTSTNWSPAPIDVGIDTTKVHDCSGYGYEGIVAGTLNYTNDADRYNTSVTITTTSSGIKTSNFYVGDIWSLSYWFKYPSKDSTGWKALVILNNNGGDADIQLGNYINCSSNTIQYSVNGKYTTAVTFTYGEWHHIAGTYDGTTLKCYLDGVYKTSVTPGQTLSRSNLGIGFRSAAANFSSISNGCANGMISDVRIYATALSEDDVKELYNIPTNIDNLGNFHSFEFVEDVGKSIGKNGLTHTSEITELNILSKLKYDTNVYIEPDGSTWVHIYHHNNPAAGSFASTDAFASSVYKDENRWFNATEICNALNKWEFLIKYAYTNTTGESKQRWVQTVNPELAVFGDVDAADITRITGSGYVTGTWGGLYKKAASAYWVMNNGNSSNWWGATGSYSIYQGGIPGYGGTVTTTGYNDLYVRIDNVDLSTLSKASIKENGIFLGNEFIEK